MLDQAMSVLNSKQQKTPDADELFGQTIGASIKEISDKRCKEFLKVKIQELVFQAQFGLLTFPNHLNKSMQPMQSPFSHPSSDSYRSKLISPATQSNFQPAQSRPQMTSYSFTSQLMSPTMISNHRPAQSRYNFD